MVDYEDWPRLPFCGTAFLAESSSLSPPHLYSAAATQIILISLQKIIVMPIHSFIPFNSSSKAHKTQDATLISSWALTTKDKGGYYIKNDLLYHFGTIAGQSCEQLCVPLSLRLQVLTLAHEVYGAHLGPKKTRDRIRLSFYWPTLTRDCKENCKICVQCQKHARTLYLIGSQFRPFLGLRKSSVTGLWTVWDHSFRIRKYTITIDFCFVIAPVVGHLLILFILYLQNEYL